MRFFFWNLEDTATNLTVQSRTWQSGLNDSALWWTKRSNSFDWQRAEVTFSTSVNSKVRSCDNLFKLTLQLLLVAGGDVWPKVVFLLHLLFSLAFLENYGRPIRCYRGHRARWYLLLQGVCVRSGQQSAQTWSHHSRTNHDLNNHDSYNSVYCPMSGQMTRSVMHNIVEKHEKTKWMSTSFFLCPNRMMSSDAGSRPTRRVLRQTYCVIIIETACRGRMKRAVVS